MTIFRGQKKLRKTQKVRAFFPQIWGNSRNVGEFSETYFPLQERTREIPSRGIGGIEKMSKFPQLPDKACPMQAYQGGPLGHQGAQ